MEKLHRWNMPSNHHQHKYSDARRLCIKHMYAYVHSKTVRRACNDYNIQEADDAEATAYAHLLNDVELFHSAALELKGKKSQRPNSSTIYELPEDGDKLSSAHAI